MNRLFVVILLFVHSAGAATVHVRTDGQLGKAVTDAQQVAANEPVTVVIHAGTYVRRQPLEFGPTTHPITLQAAEGEEVRIAGGPTISAAAFVPGDGHRLRADLKDVELGEYPDNFRGAPEAPELFFNDKRMNIARWPNEGWATIEKIIASGSEPRYGDRSGKPGVFQYSGDRPGRWNVDAGVWLQGYWCYDWYDETIRVRAIDKAKRQITLATPAMYGVKQGNPSPRRYRAINLPEELDEPGEFYLDRKSKTLYFWPPGPIKDALVALSTLKAPLLRARDATGLTIHGIIFEATLGDGIEVSGGRSVRIEHCIIRNNRQLAIRVTGGESHVIDACEMYDTGTGGLVLEGGDRKTLTPAHHQATNNKIHHFSRHQQTAAYGIVLGGVGNRAANNLIEHAPHQAVLISGNDHVFELNIVRHVVTETDDAGAVYKGRNPSCRGNIIRHNFFADIGGLTGHGTGAIYFDDGDGGDLVFGNIFLRCGDPGGGAFGTIFSHGGHGIRAENNIFIDCKRALGSVPWNDQLWKESLDGGHDCGWQEKLLKEVDITKPPYTTRYPELVGFMSPKPGEPRNSHAKNNVLLRCGDVKTGNWVVDEKTTWVTTDDPGFIDAAAGKYELRPDAPVFQRLPDFKPIPFGQIGPRH